ncbi:hypothetical protein Pcinc_012817 [Petrolisthes cinctipes]|uniref:Uncharacterized protein n=1 Tax=Petrolisthes cinctipes TaxID=88211 RepID=A0AAE1KT97_PETCI|nr:hypothetical protein Pcinc_012817 [Petrolisthes cinctipes]
MSYTSYKGRRCTLPDDICWPCVYPRLHYVNSTAEDCSERYTPKPMPVSELESQTTTHYVNHSATLIEGSFKQVDIVQDNVGV